MELKKGEVPEVVLNNLIKHSQLEQVFGINNVVLVDGKPQLCNLQQLLNIFLDHLKQGDNKNLDSVMLYIHSLYGW